MATRKLEKRKAHQRYKLKDGSIVAGCSSVVKYGPPIDGLLYWAYTRGLNGEDFNKVRDLAADIGACGHFLIETYLGGDTADLSDFSKSAIMPAEIACDNFKTMWEASGYQVISTELQMVSEKYRYGGTLDVLFLDEANRRTLGDIKITSAIRPSHKYQLAGYENLNNENHPDMPIERRCIFHVPKEPGDIVDTKWIDPKKIGKAFEIFLAQLNLMQKMKHESL